MNSINRVLIAGGTGFIGTSLKNYLENQGYEVGVLTRNRNATAPNIFYWNPATNEFDHHAFAYADFVINLAGENIAAKKWTGERKKQILDSRLQAADCLASNFLSAGFKPKKMISASAIGYYGQQTTNEIFTETSAPGTDFVAQTVQAWENVQDVFENLQIPVTRIRIGIVLSQKGGALPKMTVPVRFGIGSAIGSGKQYMPWISLRDLLHIFHFVLENEFPGEVFNAVSPVHIINRDFYRELARALKKPFFFPNIPAWLLKLILGEMSGLLLEGSRVSSEKLIKEGFIFEDIELYRTLVKEFDETSNP
ncbi:MAG TPA: TIGR01777 family oxidoreductase [Saprospiraceae bacterium]|nr:TIGR01777 family oxidoreductase [Saprospiraceae bacterium]